MRYRALDADGDYVAGPAAVFYVDSPDAVAQAIKTRLALFTGEWFLDSNEGLNMSRIVGNNTQSTRDQEVQQRILQTEGVTSIVAYGSRVNPDTRRFDVQAVVETVYGSAVVATSI